MLKRWVSVVNFFFIYPASTIKNFLRTPRRTLKRNLLKSTNRIFRNLKSISMINARSILHFFNPPFIKELVKMKCSSKIAVCIRKRSYPMKPNTLCVIFFSPIFRSVLKQNNRKESYEYVNLLIGN